MNTKKFATTIVFAALTVALNPVLTGIGIPAPYAPFLIYQLWEIPIVAAFLLIGPKSGISITILNTAVLLAIFPGALPTGPIYNLIAVLAMLLGIHVSQKVLSLKPIQPKKQKIWFRTTSVITAFTTAFGLIFRVIVMVFVNYALLGNPPPIGYSLPTLVVLGYIPLIMLFNATLALYTIPIGQYIAKTARTNLKINMGGV